MLFEKLPLELVYKVIATAVAAEEEASGALRLRGVNHSFDEEVTKCFFRERKHVYRAEAWSRIPYTFRLRWARELVLVPGKENRKQLVPYWSEVVDDLESYSKIADPEKSGLITRQQWFAEVCEILALSDSDCQCGRPAFHHFEYTGRAIRGSSFHVAFLKQHTELEIAMIADGSASFDSSCPYLQVHDSDIRRQRKNALEWAIQEGLNDTALRLMNKLEATRGDSAEWEKTYEWNTTWWVAASKGNISIIHLLHAPKEGDGHTLDIDCLAQAAEDAAKGGYWDAVQAICERFPHDKRTEIVKYAAQQGQWDILKRYITESIRDAGDTENYFCSAIEGAALGGHFQMYREILDLWDASFEIDGASTPEQLMPYEMTRNIARGGSVEILRLHLDRGFRLRTSEVVCLAASEGHVGLLEALWTGTEKGTWADKTPVSEEQLEETVRWVLALATRGGHVDTVRWLLGRVNTVILPQIGTDSREPVERNLLAMALDTGSREMTEVLLKARLSPEQWRIDDLSFSSEARRDRLNDLKDNMRCYQESSLSYRTLEDVKLNWAPQWQVDEVLQIVRG